MRCGGLSERVSLSPTACPHAVCVRFQVSKVAGVHRFTEKDSVRIVVYKDGILVKRGPFRYAKAVMCTLPHKCATQVC